jgi:hypothetical protein
MIDAVEMDGVGQGVAVLENQMESVALFDPDHRRRCAQHGFGLGATEFFGCHPAPFWGEHPHARCDPGRDRIGRKRRFEVRRAPVELGHLQAHRDMVGISVAIEIFSLHHRVGREVGFHQDFGGDPVGSPDKRGDGRGIVGVAEGRLLDRDSLDFLCRAPSRVRPRAKRLGGKFHDVARVRRRGHTKHDFPRLPQRARPAPGRNERGRECDRRHERDTPPQGAGATTAAHGVHSSGGCGVVDTRGLESA